LLARVFATDQARALWPARAAHALQPLNRPLTSAIGLGLFTARATGHGWVVAEGAGVDHRRDGQGADRPRREDRDRGTGPSADQLPAADVTLLDLAPGAVVEILGDRLPARVAKG